MKRKDEEVLTPDSANISDMQTNDEDERAESRESFQRARGKRRTAREIANMFEQLKQRHITRKKEWQVEKEDLVKKVQMADESKKVLNELKTILENLREELRHEEKKRIDMEAEHVTERQEWEAEKEDLLKRIEESAHESDRDGSDLTLLTEKLTEQTQQLTEWQAAVLDLKKQLLERENRFLRERRELQLELEKERASWKKREMLLSERIRSLDGKSGPSSASSVSPTVTPHPPHDNGVNRDNSGAQIAPSTRKRSSISPPEDTTSKYSDFQRTVDDALKQIEKINKDLNQIEEPKSDSFQQFHHLEARRSSSSSSPRPPLLDQAHAKFSPESDPTFTAPWRTKKRSTHRQPLEEITSSQGARIISNTAAASKSDRAGPRNESDILLPSINTAKLRMTGESRSPNPERKVKKIDRRGSQVDVTVSSLNADTKQDGIKTSVEGKYSPYSDRTPSDNSSPSTFSRENKVSTGHLPEQALSVQDSSSDIKKDANMNGSVVASSRSSVIVPSLTTCERGRQRQITGLKAGKSSKVEESLLNVKNEDVTRGRSSSPRLPKLHQQLLFKKEFKMEPTEGLKSQNFLQAGYSFVDKEKTNDLDPNLKSDSLRDTKSADIPKNTLPQSSTPYSQPSAGYTEESKCEIPAQETTFPNLGLKEDPATSATVRSKFQSGSRSIDAASRSAAVDKEEATPPAVQPKPKISIHKDVEGNIVRISPGFETPEALRKSVSPESTHSSEKHHSIAGRVGNVGKAGRDWIKRKFNFRERKPEEQESDERNREAPFADLHDEHRKRGKTKTRGRSSSLLRSGRSAGKTGSRRSLSTAIDQQCLSSDESTESDREEKRRESFLRRNKKKTKKPSTVGTEPKSPAKSKPKKYTRSKTEASPKDMKNFLAKFKSSQSNPNKPSVVKQFEKRLLENEVKTLHDAENGYKEDKAKLSMNFTQDKGTRSQKIGSNITHIRKKSLEGYSGEDEGDYDNWKRDNFSPKNMDENSILPTIFSGGDDDITPIAPILERRTKQGPPVKPKTYYRRSMSDFRTFENAGDAFRTTAAGIDKELRGTVKSSELPTTGRRSASVVEAGEVCSKKGVSTLVDKFSATKDSEKRNSQYVQPKISRGITARYSLRDSSSEFGKTSPQDRTIQRSHSMSSQDASGSYGQKRSVSGLSASTETTDNADDSMSTKKETGSRGHTPKFSSHSWLDRVMSKPSEDVTDETTFVKDTLSPPSGKDIIRPDRTSAPPGQYDAFGASWSTTEEQKKPVRMKMMSAEMKRKADMLEKVLVKGPRKPRRYRRADTQPVHSNFDSTDDDLTDTDDDVADLDKAFQPFMAEFWKTEDTRREREMPDDMNKEQGMHETIPPVTSRFNKPARPGRLPSRWAR